MRLGGPLFQKYRDPRSWVQAVQAKGYRAAFCPVALDAGDEEIQAYCKAAEEADIAIAEVGAWSNPLSPDEATRQAALDKCKKALALADKIKARCCVNIAGSRAQKWDGPHPENLTQPTFDLIVEAVRQIIDAVEPEHTCYTLETMPWAYPDSPLSYLRLIQAIARPQNAVHLDPVNLVNSPSRYFGNAALLRDCFAKLGPHIRSCHAKDVLLRDQLTVHLEEVRPGEGQFDYPTYLSELARLDPDIPLMLEHLPSEEECDRAASHIRGIAQEVGCPL
jgi:sugar phosphate isomerase/epimerase